ncbi:MAG: hypothetical protein ACK4QW_00685 [Alphaproteobacteria bacterium]
MIRRALTAIVVGAMLALAAPAAEAGGHGGWRGGGHHGDYRHGHGYRHDYRQHRHGYRHDYRHGHRYDRHRSRSRRNNDNLIIGAGIVGLAIVAGSLIASNNKQRSRPDVTWTDPGREPVCETDEVWRELPDGRIQYGDRTRCW